MPLALARPISGGAYEGKNPCLHFLSLLFPGCAARMAQQEIDTFNEQVIAFQQASEFMRLEKLRRISKCRGAENIFTKLSQPGGVPDSQLNAVLDYLRHAYIVQKYMNEKRVTAETALSVMGDLVYPPLLPPEFDPFNGCILDLGVPLDEPPTYRGDKFADDFVFLLATKRGPARS